MAGRITKLNGRLCSSNQAAELPVLTYLGKQPEPSILATEPADAHVVWSASGDARSTAFNRLYYGDNLPILAQLMRDSKVRGRVRLVYIDPPYATNSVFQSRDSTHAYSDLTTGADYLEFLRKRLVLLKALMADDASIYVHLDENMMFHVKVLMDDVFGPKNYRNCITRRKCSSKNYTKKSYPNLSDYILFYTKSDNYVWNRPRTEWADDHALREYPYVEEVTGRRFKKVPVHAPGVRNGATGQPWRGMMPPQGRHWKCAPEVLDALEAAGRIYWSANGNPRKKVYLDESEGLPVSDIWMDVRDAHNQNIHVAGYPTEKNQNLVERIIAASSEEGDLVLDCFAGSGTTCAAAGTMGRRWIGIDSSVEAISCAVRRLVLGTEAMKDYIRSLSAKHRRGRRTVSKTPSLFSNPAFALFADEEHSQEIIPAISQFTG